MLNHRQMEILTLLAESGRHYTGRILAGKMNVSTRTIRSDINEIKHELDKYNLVLNADNETGYFFDEQTRQKIYLSRIIEKLSDRINFDMPQTEHEMIVYLLFEFMYGSSFSIADISDQFFISESTAFGLIKKVDNLIQSKFRYSLQKDNDVWFLHATEAAERAMISGIFTQRLNESLMIKYSHFICGDKSFRNQIRFMSLLALEFTRSHGIKLSGEGIFSLSVDILLSYERSVQGYIIESQDRKPGVFGNELKNLLRKNDRIFDVLSDDDMVYLEKRLVTKPRMQEPFGVIDPKWDEVLNLFEKDLIPYNLKLSDKKQEMAFTLQRLVINKQENFYFNVMEKNQVRNMYPVFSYLALLLAEEIEKPFPGIQFNQSELAVITMMLKENIVREPLRAVLIINSGKWFVQNVLKRIRSHFDDKLLIIKVMNYWEYEADGTEADIIISTEPLPGEEKRVVQIDNMCNDESLNQIERSLTCTEIQIDTIDLNLSENSLTSCILAAYEHLNGRNDIKMNLPRDGGLSKFLIVASRETLYVSTPLAQSLHPVRIKIQNKKSVKYKENTYKEMNVFLFSPRNMDVLASIFKESTS